MSVLLYFKDEWGTSIVRRISFKVNNEKYFLLIWFFLDNTFRVLQSVEAAVVAQWIRALAPQVECWVFESQQQQT